MSQIALSVKQPWATLLIHGLKTIEVRRWPTPRRGRILIHAARVPDARKEAWAHVPSHLKEEAEIGGGIIGAVSLVECIAYPDLEKFVADRTKHLNEDSWYEPKLFGFRFENPETLPFRRYSGWFKFFQVEDAAESVQR
jgi:hypothetical protein